MFNLLWYDLLYLPLYNLLILLYSGSPFGPDMGMAVIFLTLFVRLALLPFSIRGAQSEHKLARLEPTIEELKQRYKHNVEKQRAAIKRLLEENDIGIFSNFFSLLFQILFLVVLYKIFSSGLQLIGNNQLYDIVPNPGVIETTFFGRFNLIVPHPPASLFAAGVVFFYQVLRHLRKGSQASTIDRVFLFALPAFTYIATILLPSSKAVFIATSVLFSMWIQIIQWTVLRFLIKDEDLKKNIDDLWTSS
jgi:YidC/Oxa1 family membrane protein insertase